VATINLLYIWFKLIGCVEHNRQGPLEEKHFIMRITLIIFILSLVTNAVCGQVVDANKIEQRNGLAYEIGKEVAFSGKSVAYHENGKKSRMIEYKNGEINGSLESWFPTGAREVSGRIMNKQKTGLWTAWFKNGTKVREGVFKEDKEEGEFTWWHENGQISKKGIYHNGVSDGKWQWFYENGQIKQEGVLRGEKNDGVWKDWHENGQQKMIGSFKNGVKDGAWTWWDDKGVVTSKRKYADGLLTGGNDNLDTYVEKMEHYKNQRDYKQALANIEKAIATIDDKSEDNAVYMGLAVYHSQVYSYFQHLDEAEAVLLRACGLPEADVAKIVASNSRPSDLTDLAQKIIRSPEAKTDVGPRLSLAFIYNILGDTVKLKQEQQLMMERSGMSDWVINVSMELYKIRGAKEQAYDSIDAIRDEIKNEGETKKRLYALAYYLTQIGNYSEAEKIADKALAANDKEFEFLMIKANVAMAQGNVEEMKKYMAAVEKKSPGALD